MTRHESDINHCLFPPDLCFGTSPWHRRSMHWYSSNVEICSYTLLKVSIIALPPSYHRISYRWDIFSTAYGDYELDTSRGVVQLKANRNATCLHTCSESQKILPQVECLGGKPHSCESPSEIFSATCIYQGEPNTCFD